MKPVKTIEYPSAIDAMIQNGVQVYFVDEETHKSIQKSEDHGYAIFSQLESENARRGVNVRKLGESEKP